MSTLRLLPTSVTEQPMTPPADRRARFRLLYDENFLAIEAYCFRRVPRDVAGDAVAETFLVAWRRIDDVPFGPDARPWLYGVARRVLANARRSTGRNDRLTDRLAIERGLSEQSASFSAQEATDDSPLFEALQQLSDDDQEVLRLLVWEELSHVEIGTILECSTNAVGVRVHRAKKRLADALLSAGSERSTLLPTRDESDPR